MAEDIYERLDRILAAEVESQVAFLRELISIPSDNPPGDCASHAKRVARLVGELGFTIAARIPCPPSRSVRAA
jgi:succinyl-diaminopimelate desuccinylase